ncbi:MAG: hypothetical protein U1E07_08495 [Hydrocarboniphaga sp.]|nr:hypothetical protein [Hydrocarboniphaga sp.]MDZ4078433.1 hypothetical protein [Hydrocarboniphaga sp.]
MDGQAQGRAGAGDRPGEEDSGGGGQAVRPAAVGAGKLGGPGQGWDGKRAESQPEDVREQYERKLKDLQEAYGEAMLELRARKKLQSLLGEDEK